MKALNFVSSSPKSNSGQFKRMDRIACVAQALGMT